MTFLLFIRHGENDYVKTGKMAGRIPGVHLNEKGQKQAQALGEALGITEVRNIPDMSEEQIQEMKRKIK